MTEKERTDKLYAFAFRGLLTEEALDKAGRNNKLVSNGSLDQELTERLPFELMDEQFLMRAKRMATVYTAITAFENSVRSFITKKLQEVFGEHWWEKGVPEGIRKKADSRREEEEKVKWHAHRGDDLMNYVEFGDLNGIIVKNWSSFEAHLHAQEWVASILKPLERSRNVLMHSGELGREDIERAGTLMRDWITQSGI